MIKTLLSKSLKGFSQCSLFIKKLSIRFCNLNNYLYFALKHDVIDLASRGKHFLNIILIKFYNKRRLNLFKILSETSVRKLKHGLLYNSIIVLRCFNMID